MNPLRRTRAPDDPPSAEWLLCDLNQLYTGAVYLTLEATRAEALVEHTVAAGLTDPKWCLLRPDRREIWLRALMNELHDATAAPSEDGAITTAAYHVGCAPDVLTHAQLAVIEALPSAAIREALLTLPQALRMALYYGDVEGRPGEVVAEIMAKPCRLVRLYQCRGRLALAHLLWTSVQRAGGVRQL